MNPQIAVVIAWHEALNAGDLDRLAALAHEDVEVGGPRGAGRGVTLLREWAERAGIRLDPGRIFQRDGEVVVEQRATWRSPHTGRPGEPQLVASAFLVRDGRVQRLTRYQDLAAALQAVGLDASHEVRQPISTDAPPTPPTEPPAAPAADELAVSQDGPVRRITLTRPARRNALSRSLVAALARAFASIDAGGETRVVILAGDGPAFCAGGDIEEFVASAESGRARADAEGLAALFAAIAACPVPAVARVHGAAYGAGVGLVAAADLAVAADDTRFSLSEARLGLVPAVVAPYVVPALGPREAKAKMLLAAPFVADEALRIGLIHRAAPPDRLDAAVADVVADLLRGAPGALATIKRLPAMVGAADPAAAHAAMTNLLAERLASDEAQEGFRAFLEKRSAAWVPEQPEPQ